jgi:hypothetical protein
MCNLTSVEGRMMWSGFDPVFRQLQIIRDMAALQHQTPTHEWPLIFVDEHDALLVIREWPNGSMTCYTTSESTSHAKRDNPSEPGQ